MSIELHCFSLHKCLVHTNIEFHCSLCPIRYLFPTNMSGPYKRNISSFIFKHGTVISILKMESPCDERSVRTDI